MTPVRRHTSFLWLLALAFVALLAGGFFLLQHERGQIVVAEAEMEVDALRIVQARAAALHELSEERIAALTGAYAGNEPSIALSRNRAMALQQLIDTLASIRDGGGPLSTAAAVYLETLLGVEDPTHAGLTDAERFDAFLALDDALCCPPVGIRELISTPRISLVDDVLAEISFDAFRFERIAGGFAVFDGAVDGPPGSLADWMWFDITQALEASTEGRLAPLGERIVDTADARVVVGLRDLNLMAAEETVRAADEWVASGAAASGEAPAANLAAVSVAARRVVDASATFFDDLVVAELEAAGAGATAARSSITTLRLLISGAIAAAGCSVALAVRRLRKDRERAVQSRREAARQLRFLANVSHEIRSPLTAISGFVEMLRGDFSSMSEEEIHEYLEIVGDQARHLAALVEDVLTVSKLEAEQLSLNVADVELRSSIQGVVDVVFSNVDKQVTVDVPSDAVVRADELRLSQVVRNLSENAAKYGGTRVRVRARRQTTHYRVEVSDNGRGVRPEDQERIFQRFEQGGGSGAGFGLGLSIAHDLATAMGGQMGFEPVEPHGAAFWFTVPASADLAHAA